MLPLEIIDPRPEQFIPQEVVNQVKQLFAQYRQAADASFSWIRP